VAHLGRVALIPDHRRQPGDQPGALLGRGRQQHPAIGGDVAAIEAAPHLLAAQDAELKLRNRLYHRGDLPEIGLRLCTDPFPRPPIFLAFAS
jgi:hypothetical protein